MHEVSCWAWPHIPRRGVKHLWLACFIRRYYAGTTVYVTRADHVHYSVSKRQRRQLEVRRRYRMSTCDVRNFQVRAENRQLQLCVISTFCVERKQLDMFCQTVFFRHKLTVGTWQFYASQSLYSWSAQGVSGPLRAGRRLEVDFLVGNRVRGVEKRSQNRNRK